jgi:hypothetical protein
VRSQRRDDEGEVVGLLLRPRRVVKAGLVATRLDWPAACPRSTFPVRVSPGAVPVQRVRSAVVQQRARRPPPSPLGGLGWAGLGSFAPELSSCCCAEQTTTRIHHPSNRPNLVSQSVIAAAAGLATRPLFELVPVPVPAAAVRTTTLLHQVSGSHGR